MVRVEVVESFITLNAVYWYGADNGAILLYRIFGDGTFIPDVGKYTSALNVVATSVEDYNGWLTELRYNNPVENRFNLSFNNKETGEYNYKMVNCVGQVVFSGNDFAVAGEHKNMELDLGNIAPGIYFLTFQNKNGINGTTIKLMKN